MSGLWNQGDGWRVISPGEFGQLSGRFPEKSPTFDCSAVSGWLLMAGDHSMRIVVPQGFEALPQSPWLRHAHRSPRRSPYLRHHMAYNMTHRRRPSAQSLRRVEAGLARARPPSRSPVTFIRPWRRTGDHRYRSSEHPHLASEIQVVHHDGRGPVNSRDAWQSLLDQPLFLLAGILAALRCVADPRISRQYPPGRGRRHGQWERQQVAGAEMIGLEGISASWLAGELDDHGVVRLRDVFSTSGWKPFVVG